MGTFRVWVGHFSLGCNGGLMGAKGQIVYLSPRCYWASHVPFWQLSIDLILASTHNFKLLAADWQPSPVKARFHFISIFMLVRVILCQLICRGETTDLSSEPARWTNDYCQRMSDFDICRFILIRMAYKLLISPRSNVTFNISLHKVSVRVGVHYVITKFSPMDSLPNFLTYGAPLAHASRAGAPLWWFATGKYGTSL